jgi:hypothetical protein
MKIVFCLVNKLEDLNKIQNSCVQNELNISGEKTKVMFFKLKDGINVKIKLRQVKCEGKHKVWTCSNIEITKVVKYLDVWIDNQYNF